LARDCAQRAHRPIITGLSAGTLVLLKPYSAGTGARSACGSAQQARSRAVACRAAPRVTSPGSMAPGPARALFSAAGCGRGVPRLAAYAHARARRVPQSTTLAPLPPSTALSAKAVVRVKAHSVCCCRPAGGESAAESMVCRGPTGQFVFCADSHNRLQVPQARERVVQVVRVWLCPRQQRVRLCEHHVKPALHRPSPHASFMNVVLAAAQAAHAEVTECASRAQRTGPCSCVAGTCAPKRAPSTLCQRTLCTGAVSAPGTETRPAQPAPLTAAAGAPEHTG